MAALMDTTGQVVEVKGDMFACPGTSSLVHCISKDCKMGKGIAAVFKQKFGGIQDLIKQGKNPGQTAILRRGDRFIYYMVTKEKYWEKPTYASLKLSLEDVLAHCKKNDVTRLCMPRIGCGLDELQWPKVKQIIVDTFQESDIRVTVYTL